VIDSKTDPPEDREKHSRRRRIASIKEKVEAGTYAVDPAELSKKIVEAHLSKKAASKD
jgi:anti-sigma28 factor (negative regulator of flagellin synthesis)